MLNTLKNVSIIAAIALAGSAQAAVIDLTTATNDGTTLVATEATITATTGSTLFVGDFIANSVCPIGDSGCNGSMLLEFLFDVTNVMFDYGFGGVGDMATLSIFDGLGNLLGAEILTSNAGVVPADLSAFGTIRSIFFDNTASTAAGYAYGDISYDVAAAVPLPASLPLLLAGLAGFAALRRKRNG